MNSSIVISVTQVDSLVSCLIFLFFLLILCVRRPGQTEAQHYRCAHLLPPFGPYVWEGGGGTVPHAWPAYVHVFCVSSAGTLHAESPWHSCILSSPSSHVWEGCTGMSWVYLPWDVFEPLTQEGPWIIWLFRVCLWFSQMQFHGNVYSSLRFKYCAFLCV